MQQSLNNRLRAIAAAAMIAAISATPAQALTFDFFWSGDPTVDTNLISSDDPTAKAMGTITLDPSLQGGDSFGLNDLSSANIFVSGDTFEDFAVSAFDSLRGLISADRSSAAITSFQASDPIPGVRFPDAFGCEFNTGADCEVVDGDRTLYIVTKRGRQAAFFNYSSTEDAQQSFQLTRSEDVAPIPIPATLPLLLGGIGALAVFRRRRYA